MRPRLGVEAVGRPYCAPPVSLKSRAAQCCWLRAADKRNATTPPRPRPLVPPRQGIRPRR